MASPFTKKPTVVKMDEPPRLPQSVAPPLSHRAASVAQEMETLEAELSAAIAYGRQQEQRAMVAEGLLKEARRMFDDQQGRDKAEISHLLNERDHWHHMYTEIHARLKSVSASIIDVVTIVAPKAETEALKAIESAIAAPVEEPAKE